MMTWRYPQRFSIDRQLYFILLRLLQAHLRNLISSVPVAEQVRPQDRPLPCRFDGRHDAPGASGLETVILKLPLWRFFAYALVILLGLAVALPTFLPRNIAEALPGTPVSLGLDLRGGASLTLRADEAAIRQGLLSDYAAALSEVTPALRAISNADGAGLTIATPDGMTPEAAMAAARAAMPEVAHGPLSQPEPAFALVATDGGLTATLRASAVALVQADAVSRSIEVIRTRIDEAGVAEPSIQSLGRDRILVQMPGVTDPASLRALLGATAQLTFHRVVAEGSAGSVRLTEAGGAAVSVEARPALDGERLADASAAFDPDSGAPTVQFRFDAEGARIFGELTQSLVGQQFAIVLDEEVISAPVIQEPILGGSGVISGAFTVEETTTLAALLRAGALPVPLEVIEERTVGADLGADAISMGLWTGLAGFGLVAAMMVALYGAWGAVATAALLINVALTIAALVLLGATLTLPGIAGLILGMGLAVDANVLINERIREETRAGKRAASAVQAGFDRAYRAILDSNLTTLIATALLFWLGSGPVRGFALTMGLGIAISLFTAVAVVRAAMDIHLRWRGPKTFEIRPLFGFLASGAAPSFRFMRARFVGLAVSLVLSVASIWLFVSPGLNYGVDFRGGALIEARLDAPGDLAELRAGLETLGLGEVSLQESDGGRSVLVRVEQQPGGEAAQTAAAEAVRGVVQTVSPDAQIDRVEIVGPRVSTELAVAGLIAVAAASLAMLVYIWARFDWPYAVGAIATLVLDITKTVGFLALFGLDFGLTAIAALLTLIGYSVNDKVVVYDRMRENSERHPAMPLRDLIDLSINQTLARSLYTSGTALSGDVADGDLGWCCGAELRHPDGIRHRRRRLVVDLHRGANPALSRRLAAEKQRFRRRAVADHRAMIDEAFWQIAAVGFAAQMVDGALGMAYGLTSTSLLLTLGYSPAAASAAVHLAETATTAVSAGSHHLAGNVDWALVRPLAIAGVLGGVVGASLLATGAGEALRPFVSAYLAVMGGVILWKAFRNLPGIRPPKGLVPLGGIGGFLDAIGGGGWGPIVSGTLVASGNSARHMIGSAIAAEFFVTTAIAVTFAGHLGFREFGIAALALVVGGVPAAPFAALILRVAPRRALMVGVGLLIVFLGFQGLWRTMFHG